MSFRPPVRGYIIDQNITGAQIQFDPSDSSEVISDATIGSVYTVRIAATNVLGTGTFISTTIS